MPRDPQGAGTRTTTYWRIRSQDGVSAGYDYLAREFRRDTGKMAPGKDVPAAMGGGDWQATMEEFHEWRKANGLYPPDPRFPVPEEGGR